LSILRQRTPRRWAAIGPAASPRPRSQGRCHTCPPTGRQAGQRGAGCAQAGLTSSQAARPALLGQRRQAGERTHRIRVPTPISPGAGNCLRENGPGASPRPRGPCRLPAADGRPPGRRGGRATPLRPGDSPRGARVVRQASTPFGAQYEFAQDAAHHGGRSGSRGAGLRSRIIRRQFAATRSRRDQRVPCGL